MQGCSYCSLQNRTRSKRSIDFNDVLKLPAYRMPRDLKPLNYQLNIHPSTNDATFKARVRIDAVWSVEGSRIKLDAHRDLHITEVDIKCLNTNGTWVISIWSDQSSIIELSSGISALWISWIDSVIELLTPFNATHNSSTWWLLCVTHFK